MAALSPLAPSLAELSPEAVAPMSLPFARVVAPHVNRIATSVTDHAADTRLWPGLARTVAFHAHVPEAALARTMPRSHA
jgi:hypothetical protein